MRCSDSTISPPAVVGNLAADEAGIAALRDDRDARGGADLHDLRDLCGRARPHDSASDVQQRGRAARSDSRRSCRHRSARCWRRPRRCIAASALAALTRTLLSDASPRDGGGTRRRFRHGANSGTGQAASPAPGRSRRRPACGRRAPTSPLLQEIGDHGRNPALRQLLRLRKRARARRIEQHARRTLRVPRPAAGAETGRAPRLTTCSEPGRRRPRPR